MDPNPNPLTPGAPRRARPRSRHGSWQTRLRAFVLAGLVVTLLGACATGTPLLRTELTTFHEWPAELERSYVLVAPVGTAAGPAQQAVEAEAELELSKLGFARAAAGASARLAVTLRVRLVPQVRQVVEPMLADPFWRGRWDTRWYPPGWYGGFAGYREYPITVYQRSLSLTIDDLRSRSAAGAPRRLYEGTVQSTGASDALPAIAPYLVRALFTDFPGTNGQTRTIDVPVDLPRP